MKYCVYILTNKLHTVFYTGVTNDIKRRVYEHKNGLTEGFTKKYKVHKLVYMAYFDDVRVAIENEKRVKDWRREKKIALISELNPEWRDLYTEV